MNEFTLNKEKIKYGFNKDGSFHFGGIDINLGETYIDAIVRTTSARQRALTGLSFKLISLRMKKEKEELKDMSEEEKIKYEIDRLKNMTDEEYDKECYNESKS